MKNILFILLLIFTSQSDDKESHSIHLTNRNSNVTYIEMYALNEDKNENYQIGVYACKLENNEKLAFYLIGDTLILNSKGNIEKVDFKHDLLEVFIYNSKDPDNMFFCSSPNDTLFLKQFKRFDFFTINDTINIK